MRPARWLAAAALPLLLAQGSEACIEALDLQKMVMRTDAAVLGTITDVHTVRWDPEDDDRMIYTVVTVDGEDLYTGEKRTLEAAFVGGVHQGEAMLVTSMPAPSEYRVGNQVLIFSAPVEGWGPDVDRCLYASMGGIFRTLESKKGLIVMGKGRDFAVERNQYLADLQKGILAALAAKRETQQ